MSPAKLRTDRVTLIELLPDGTTKERFQGDCDAYLLSVVAAFASADVVYGILPSAGLEGEGLEGGAP